ncbi:hypothetical protein SFRURICE_011548 [Spodoptera frugiperda]|nr:hypothetical protein SFRURICE_011548 [Spodoptera frugiperda]
MFPAQCAVGRRSSLAPSGQRVGYAKCFQGIITNSYRYICTGVFEHNNINVISMVNDHISIGYEIWIKLTSKLIQLRLLIRIVQTASSAMPTCNAYDAYDSGLWTLTLNLRRGYHVLIPVAGGERGKGGRRDLSSGTEIRKRGDGET